jgi:hypothetical protein
MGWLVYSQPIILIKGISVTSNLSKYINRQRLDEFRHYLREMNKRSLADWYGHKYEASEPQLSSDIMYFSPLVLAPSDRREIAKHIVGIPNSVLPVEDKVLNCTLSYLYGPTAIYHYLSGKSNPADAHIHFDRVYHDPEYVTELRENIAYARLHGHKMWTTYELHTSVQTAGRNYCRVKYNDPDRKASDLDVVEWLASLRYDGTVDRILNAKTLQDGYDQLTSVRGIGPYFGGNSILMIANLAETEYTHDEPFCAPGGGAIRTINYLFEDFFKAGHKMKPEKIIAWFAEHQAELLEDVTVPSEFANMDVSYGKLLKNDQTVYTCNSFEVAMCQFSVYCKFKEDPEAMKRRPNPPPVDMTPFIAREQGNPMLPDKASKTSKTVEPVTRMCLLEVD